MNMLQSSITNLLNPSESLGKANELQQSIIDHISNHYIFWKDKNSVYLGCNAALAQVLGLKSSRDIIGKTDFDLPTTKEESEAYRADDKAVMSSKKAKLNIEEPQTLPDGSKKILLTSKVPLFDQKGDVYGILAIYSDITQQRKIEENAHATNLKLEREYQMLVDTIDTNTIEANKELDKILKNIETTTQSTKTIESLNDIKYSAEKLKTIISKISNIR